MSAAAPVRTLSAKTLGVLAVLGLVVAFSLSSTLVKRAESPGVLVAFWRMITGDSQLRWVGPEKGVIHLATAAVVNAVWDLWAKAEKKPVWRLLCDMSPEEIVRCIDFRYITDALTPEDWRALFAAN